MQLKYHFTTLAILCSLTLSAQVKTDTLDFHKNSSVFITYEVKRGTEDAEVNFIEVQLRNCNRFVDDVKNLGVVFFYERSGYDKEFKGNIERTPISISGNLQLKHVDDEKYVLLDPNRDNDVSLKFKLTDDNEGQLDVPIFLAENVHEKKWLGIGKSKDYYQLRPDWVCGTLHIPLSRKRNADVANGNSGGGPQTKTITEEVVIEDPDNEDILKGLDGSDIGGGNSPSPEELKEQEQKDKKAKATKHINDIYRELAETDKLPFSITLSTYRSELISLKNDIEDEQFRTQIQAALDSCTNKEKALQEAEEASGKKRTIWMIIGGVLLAALSFIGNHIFQVRRNKSMMEMTENLGRRTIENAERRAKGMARSKVNREVNAIKRKSKEAISAPVKEAFKSKKKDDTKNKDKNNGKIISI